MKVILNSCFGGFHVSDEAIKYCNLNSFKGDLHLSQELASFIEKFGSEKASGRFSRLRVEEIEPGTRFKIDEYDGQEWITKEKDIKWITATDDSYVHNFKTLRDLLNEDGYTRCSDEMLLVHFQEGGDMAINHRYLDCVIWQDELNSRAERIKQGEYKIISS